MKKFRDNYSLAVIAVIAVGLILRLLFAYHAFYDPEELHRIRIANAETFSRFLFESKMDLTPFLDIFLLRFLCSIFDSEFALRTCQVAISAIYLFVLYKVSWRMLNNRSGGALVVAMAALSPLHVFYSGIVRYHNLNALFVLLSIYYFHKLLEDIEGYKPSLAYGVSTAAAMMTQYYTIYLVGAQLVYLVSFHSKRLSRLWLKLLVAFTAAFVFFLPFIRVFLFQIQKADSKALEFLVLIKGFLSKDFFNLIDSIFGFILGDFYLIHGDGIVNRILLFSALFLFTAMFAVFIRMILKRKMSREILFPAVILGIVLILSYGLRDVSTAAISAKYFLPFVFLLYMIFAGLLLSLKDKATKTILTVAVFAILILAQANMISALMEKPTVSTAAESICEDIDENGGVVVFSSEITGIPGVGIDYSYETPMEYFAEYAPCEAEVALIDDGRYKGQTRLRQGKLSVIRIIPPGDDAAVRTLFEEKERIWMFFYNQSRDPEQYLKNEMPPTEAYRALSATEEPAESIVFKVSPRRDYFLGGAYLFVKKK